jgi:hypothetical protein
VNKKLLSSIIGLVLLTLLLAGCGETTSNPYAAGDPGTSSDSTSGGGSTGSTGGGSISTTTDGGTIQTTNSGNTGGGGDWCHNKVNWLLANAPQGVDGADMRRTVASKAGVPTTRVRPTQFTCNDGVSAYDGAIINGPNEGWSDEVTYTATPGGALDSYLGAKYSTTPDTITVEGNIYRVYGGQTVTATTITVWYYSDLHPPSSGAVVEQAASTDAAQAQPAEVIAGPNCMLGTVLAESHGWKLWSDQGNTAKFGGAVVLKDRGGLPDGWSENCSTDLVGGKHVCSIYPPDGACRDALKVSR